MIAAFVYTRTLSYGIGACPGPGAETGRVIIVIKLPGLCLCAFITPPFADEIFILKCISRFIEVIRFITPDLASLLLLTNNATTFLFYLSILPNTVYMATTTIHHYPLT